MVYLKLFQRINYCPTLSECQGSNQPNPQVLVFYLNSVFMQKHHRVNSSLHFKFALLKQNKLSFSKVVCNHLKY